MEKQVCLGRSAGGAVPGWGVGVMALLRCKHGTTWRLYRDGLGRPSECEMIESAGAGCSCNADEAEEVE